MFFHVISTTSLWASSPWLHTLGNSCVFDFSLQSILPCGKIVLGAPIKASRVIVLKKKKKKTRLTSIVFDFSATWHCGHMKPPEKRPSLSTEHLPRLLGSLIFNKEAECTVLSPPCCSCPRREVSGSFIPNIWGNTFWYTVTRMSLHF